MGMLREPCRRCSGCYGAFKREERSSSVTYHFAASSDSSQSSLSSESGRMRWMTARATGMSGDVSSPRWASIHAFALSSSLATGWPRSAATISATASVFEQSGASRYSSPISVTVLSAAEIVEVSEIPQACRASRMHHHCRRGQSPELPIFVFLSVVLGVRLATRSSAVRENVAANEKAQRRSSQRNSKLASL